MVDGGDACWWRRGERDEVGGSLVRRKMAGPIPGTDIGSNRRDTEVSFTSPA